MGKTYKFKLSLNQFLSNYGNFSFSFTDWWNERVFEIAANEIESVYETAFQGSICILYVRDGWHYSFWLSKNHPRYHEIRAEKPELFHRPSFGECASISLKYLLSPLAISFVSLFFFEFAWSVRPLAAYANDQCLLSCSQFMDAVMGRLSVPFVFAVFMVLLPYLIYRWWKRSERRAYMIVSWRLQNAIVAGMGLAAALVSVLVIEWGPSYAAFEAWRDSKNPSVAYVEAGGRRMPASRAILK